eukprot:552471_1
MEAGGNLFVTKSNGKNCFGKKETKIDIKSCDYLCRILHALQLYKSLNNLNNPSNDNINIWTDFCLDKYTQIVDDYSHIISSHSEQIEEINNQLINDQTIGNCIASNCTLLTRYYGRRRSDDIHEAKNDSKENEPEIQEKLSFYVDLLESMHYWLFHLFHTGMRTKKNIFIETDNKTNDNEEENKYENEQKHFDIEFAKMRKYIVKQREALNIDIERSDEQNNKFKIGTVSNVTNNNKMTGMQRIFKVLQQNKISNKNINSFAVSLMDEEYDTDAVFDDADDDDPKNSNLFHIVDVECAHIVSQYVQDSQVSVFSTGFCWFYWEYYKDLETVTHLQGNENDYGGYLPKELYVEPKYANYKEELLQHVTVDIFKQKAVVKADEYMATEAVKSMKANDMCNKDVYYGIEKGSPLRKNHLISVIMYCDVSKYCTKFSSTFRKLDSFENITSIKARNAEFYFQSKYFRELVECFGSYGYDDRDGFRDNESGPFFTGIDCILIIPQFRIRLYGPTSTSKQIQVATNFAKRGGMIVTLNNDQHIQAYWLPFFNCNWLSGFCDEDERIFCGGFMSIRIKTVRIIETRQNFKKPFKVLGLLDAVLTGTTLCPGDKLNITSKDIKSINKLIESTTSFDQYISSIFKAYRKNKTHISIFSAAVRMDFKGLIGLIFESEIKWIKKTQFDFNDLHTISSRVNLISSKIFTILPNITQIVIETQWDPEHKFCTAFNLLYFLEIICVSSTWKRIKIQETLINKKNLSWIYKMWSSCSQEIQSIYNQKHLTIQFQQTKKNVGHEVDSCECLIIERGNDNH